MNVTSLDDPFNGTTYNVSNVVDFNYTEDFGILYVLGKVEFYYTPFLMMFGSAGNCLSVIVFFSTKLKKLSSSYYLAALAGSDTGFLLSLFMFWLHMIDPIFYTNGLCKLCIYLSYVSSFLSVWFVVAFTVERFIAVCYPLRRNTVCTVSRAKCVSLCLTILGLVSYSPIILIAKIFEARDRPGMIVCGLNEEYVQLGSIVNHVDTIVTLVLPFGTIVVLNFMITRAVWRLARVRRTMTQQNKKTPATNGGVARTGTVSRSLMRGGADLQSPAKKGQAENRIIRSQSQTKITKMLLVVSTAFIVLNLPSYAIRIWVFFKPMDEPEIEARKIFIILQHTFNMLFNTNFAINFVLYCISGQNFRKALLSLCRRERNRRNDTQTTVVSEYTRSIGSISRRQTVTTNGMTGSTWKDAHEMIPLTK